ncbi:MAG: hypothetical protein WCY28_02520 [Candidatus Shapirobacteria bacterium]
MNKFFSLIGFLATIVLVVLFNHITGFEIHSFSLFFIIPVGGLLVGAGASAGFFYGQIKYHKPIRKNQYLIGALLGFIAFFGVYYVSYLTTYVAPDNEINYSFEGDHISNFEIDGERITFSKYLEINNQAESQFYFRGRPMGEGIETGGIVNSIFFYLQLLASILAGAGVGLVMVGDRKYCDKCKRYTEQKELLKFNVDQYEQVILELTKSINNPSALKKSIEKLALKEEKVIAFAQVELQYCPNCYESCLIIKIMKLNSKSEFEELKEFRQFLPLKEEIAKSLIDN